MPATVIVDALWGDSGKGKLSAFLARKHDVPLAVRAGIGTNAGASVILDDGTTVRARQLPTAWLNPGTTVRARQLPTAWLNPGTTVAVGSGVLVDPEVLLGEVERFGLHGRAMVDYRCAVITPEHRRLEREDEHLGTTVGSTRTGNGYARADLMLRRATLVRDVPELAPFAADVVRHANEVASRSRVIVQASQGTQLSLALSDEYPYVTSDNCTTAAAIDDVGLNWRLVDEVVLIVKVMPTRVGNGPLPHEMSAEEIVARGVAEYGVVTGRPRRKASRVDEDLLRFAVMVNGPTRIALTFCDHYDPEIRGRRDPGGITPPVAELIAWVERVAGVPVGYVDTGKGANDVIDLGT